MMPCSSDRTPCILAACSPCGGSAATSPQSLAEVVRNYCWHYRPRAETEHVHWASHTSFPGAVRAAALSEFPCGRRHPHQRRIPARVLRYAADALTCPLIPARRSFHDLLHAVHDRIGDIHGIGELAVYDITCRIGASLGLRPERIYLHAGTREGARAFGLRGSSVSKSDLPQAFGALSPAEIEDCLCIYKADIQRLMGAPRT